MAPQHASWRKHGLMARHLLAVLLGICLFVPLHAQNPSPMDDTTAWKKVEAFQKEGKPRSALEVVDQLYERATATGDGPTLIKALIHKVKFRYEFEEQADSLIVAMLQRELKAVQAPERSLVQVLLADVYWKYYQMHRWRILNRTELDVAADDFQAWDEKQFHRVISELYLQALAPAQMLQQTAVRDYEQVLITANASDTYRPTLYDLLAHHALEYFSNSETWISEPVNAFELKAENVLVDIPAFLRLDLPRQPTSSRTLRVLAIFQDLLAFHNQKRELRPLLDANLKRLKYLREHATGAEVDTLYLRRLEALVDQYAQHPYASELRYEMAHLYVERARSYEPLTSDAYQWDRKRALAMCEATMDAFPDGPGTQRCRQLVNEIQQKSLALTAEDIMVPGQAFRVRVDYQNVAELHVRVIRQTPDMMDGRDRTKMAQLMAQAPVVAYRTYALNELGDYQPHSTEIDLPKLDPGAYLLLASDNASFDLQGHALAFVDFEVSTLSYVFRTENEQLTGVVMHRETGEPLSDVAVELLSWDYKARDYRKTGALTQTGKDGLFALNLTPDYGRSALEMRWKGETTRSERVYRGYASTYDSQEREQVYFFTDRKIYRPGQTISFKVLALKGTEREHKVLTGHPVTVSFLDVNRQQISALSLTTNEYGTAHGSFTAPSAGLLGTMRLQTDHGQTEVRVEEYKRPTFELSLDPVQGSYALGDEITVTGSAASYAGAVLDGVEVSYRVLREARFPYWFRWWLPQPQSPAREIASGALTADEGGAFSFTFTAAPDAAIDPETQPIFTYRVVVDVQDITGETHSASQSIRAGYVSLEVDVEVAEEITLRDPGELQVVARNLNGQAEAIKGQVTLFALQSPDEVLSSRRWEAVDQHLLSEKAYKKLFPHEVYGQEGAPRHWAVGEQVWQQPINTEQSTSLSLDALASEEEGWYKLVLTTEAEGLKVVRFVQLVDPEARRLRVPQVLQVLATHATAQPGETVEFTLASSEKKVWVLYELQQEGKVLKRDWVFLKKKKKTLRLPIKEAHRGNVTASFSLVRHNEFIQKARQVAVPWENKQLSLEWGTFRSKLQPGQEEQWKLTIKGPKGDAVAAELVASLYDASLDVFRANRFSLNLYPSYFARPLWNPFDGFGTNNSVLVEEDWNPRVSYPGPRAYDQLNWFGFQMGGNRFSRRAVAYSSMAMGAAPGADASANGERLEKQRYDSSAAFSPRAEEEVGMMEDDRLANQAEGDGPTEGDVPIRANLQETAFFFPQLETNEAGEVVLNFTMPEALTRWKFLGLAHTKELQVGLLEGETVTQKELMVVPNLPRFLREGDSLRLSAKVVNLSEQALSGHAELKLLDAFSMQPVAASFDLGQASQAFAVAAGQSSPVHWQIAVPDDVQAVVVQVVAKAGTFSDGEEHVLPVLKNRMLVTESLPLAVRGNESKTFRFKKLLENDSETLQHQKLTLEFTSNPAWYAVQALPYLMEFPHECTEQIFSRFYANALASHIANQSPQTRQVFEQWRAAGQDGKQQALLSQLEKNQDLKNVLLQETPWVLNARSETERKRRVGMLFDLNRMSNELSKARRQLQARQNNDGSFSWFPGMPSSRYITQLIVTGMGQLQKLGVGMAAGNPEVAALVQQALPYLDRALLEDYERMKQRAEKPEDDHLGAMQVQYLYMRSFFREQAVERQAQEAFEYYFKQGQRYWTEKSPYLQGMLALVYSRYEEAPTAKNILASLKERAVFSDELGMYWKQPGGYFWYQAPIEQQALMIEAFEEAGKDLEAVEELKVWLLKNKQTNDWESTRATVAACNALLSSGTDWLEQEALAEIVVGGQPLNPYERADVQVEAGTGYFKTAWLKDEVQPEMGEIQVNKQSEGIAWGSLYWQYFEQLDKITYAATPLRIQKQLFVETNTGSGPQLMAIDEGTPIEVGDKVVVRVELRVDRAMEYVHMKDMRAAGFEPLNVLSSYRYKAGLGYYESTRDAATHFFFEYLPKGTHVFEYPLRATLSGDFSNGITQVQCMYAPEFTSHSEGIRVQVQP